MQASLFSSDILVKPPTTGWLPPPSFPELSGAGKISIDLETCDPHLKELGPGCSRGEGFIAGVSVGTDDGWRGYFPIRHEIGGNFDPAVVTRWLRAQLSRDHQPKVFANCLYDLEWLASVGVEVAGEIHDVQLAEPLLDENLFTYSLDSLGERYLGEGKTDYALYQWLAQVFGGPATRTAQAGRIWRAPATLVGPYAEGDVDLPLRILERQARLLREQGLWDLYRMECGLIPMLLRMRRHGVRVDVAGAERVNNMLKERIRRDEKLLRELVGYPVNFNAAESFAKFFDREGVPYPRTPKTNKPSITMPWLEACPHSAAKLILALRKWDKFRSTFMEGYILNKHINGRIHGQFHLLKADDSGTISGRMSSSLPNLQNIPARDKELGPMVRALFLPDEGDDWFSADYSQIEYRMMAHYGAGQSAERMRKTYCEDLHADFHQLTADMAGISRKQAKGLGFGISYGGGIGMVAEQLGIEEEAARRILDNFNKEVPFISELSEQCCKVAERRGWLRTVLGRRARFPLWESRDWATSKKDGPMPYDTACTLYSERGIRRARCYTALNRLSQGSAADVYKAGQYKAWQAGVFEVLKPLSHVHDENNSSKPRTVEAQEAADELKHCMETAVELLIPLLVEYGIGPNWAEAKGV